METSIEEAKNLIKSLIITKRLPASLRDLTVDEKWIKVSLLIWFKNDIVQKYKVRTIGLEIMIRNQLDKPDPLFIRGTKLDKRDGIDDGTFKWKTYKRLEQIRLLRIVYESVLAEVNLLSMNGKKQYDDWGIRSELSLENCIKAGKHLIRFYEDAFVRTA